jgi:pimeloyl-ACP methyl ester carboxylesterase
VDGPVVVLVHGLASDSDTWDAAMAPLAERGLHVIAPDLLGHGRSDKPSLPYCLDVHAETLRHLLERVGARTATFVGHSLGGAIAMHLGYHAPQVVDRLVLVASGGLGRQVHPLLRAAALPGTRAILAMAVNPGTARVYRSPRLHRALRLTDSNVVNLARAGRNLITPAGRYAFVTTLRSVIEPSGQRGNLVELNYVAEHVPTQLIWAEHDHVIPVRHAHATHALLPGSRLDLLPGASHEPHRRYAERFARLVADFVAATPTAHDAAAADEGAPSTGGSTR